MNVKTSSLRKFASLVLLGTLLSSQVSVRAFETDQYNLPSKPLADIGNEVSEHVREKLSKAVAKIDAEIERRQQCVDARTAGQQHKSCDSTEAELLKLAYLRSEDGITREVYEQLGDGIVPFTHMGTWMDTHRFQGQPARYRTSFFKSIFILPHVTLTISPTVQAFEIRLKPGTREVTVTKDGFAAFGEQVALSDGKREVLRARR